MTDLGTAHDINYSEAYGINDSGQVVGWSDATNWQHAFLYSNGTMTDLGTLGGRTSVAWDINDSGQAVGRAETAAEVDHAFLYSNGTMSDLGTPGDYQSGANAINDSGQVVGWAQTASGMHGFLHSNGTRTELGTLGGWSSWAFGINNSGQVVGTADTASGETHAFLLCLKVDTSSVIHASTHRSVFGEPVTFTATISSTEPNSETPTGTVTFMDGGATLGSVVLTTADGVTSAMLTTTTLTAGTHSVTVMYSGDDTFNGSESADSAVISVDMPPEDVELLPNHVREQSPAGTVVGRLITPGSQFGDVFTYSLVAGLGDADNAAFAVVGDVLTTATVLDYETQSSHSIRVRTTDEFGLWYEKALTVDVVNVPPAVAFSQAAGQFDPASSLPIHFTVVFSEPVTGLAPDDFTVSGDAPGTPLVTLTGNGQTYDVAVDELTNTGTVTLALRSSAAQDGADVPSSWPLVIDDTVLYRPWTNQRKPADVAAEAEFSPYVTPNDEDVSANDVLAIINFINQNDSGLLPPPPANGAPEFYDVNADGWATPLDVLMVINYINAHTAALGEGEATGGLEDILLARTGTTDTTDAVFATMGNYRAFPLPLVMPFQTALARRSRGQQTQAPKPCSFSDAGDASLAEWEADIVVSLR